MTVAESAVQADTRSVCVIRTTVDSVATDKERRAGLSAIAEPLVFADLLVTSLFRGKFTAVVWSMTQNELRRTVRRRHHHSSAHVSTNQRISDIVFRLGRRGRRHGRKVLQIPEFYSRFSRIE